MDHDNFVQNIKISRNQEITCRWYALVDHDNFVQNIKISRNQEITCLHVKDAAAWVANTKHRVVKRDTLLFDYMYFIHPTAIGHWCAPPCDRHTLHQAITVLAERG